MMFVASQLESSGWNVVYFIDYILLLYYIISN